jgi:hypothetical protein
VKNKKPDETVVTIDNDHWQANAIRPFILLIDGESVLHFLGNQEYDIVLSPGRHAFAVIEKNDPLDETLIPLGELDIGAGEMELYIEGEGSVYSVVDSGGVDGGGATKGERKAAAEQTEKNFVPQFRQYSGGRPGQDEAVLKISCDAVFFWIYPDVYFWLDDQPVTFRESKDEISFIIPNGRHKIRATIWGAQDWSKDSRFFKEAEFTANSNLLSVVYDVGWGISYGADLEVEEKKL